MFRATGVCLIAMVAAACCTGAAAADLPLEQGTFTDTFYAYGTFKGYSVGKTRYTNAEEDGFFVGEGLRNHMTVHCFAMSERLNETQRSSGHCILTDIDGDHIAVDATVDWHPNGAKEFSGDATFTAGTGKYEGITGGFKEVCHNGVFRAAADNAFFAYCTNEGNYKLP